MDMSDRKLQILQAIIMNYLETAEPVGSRTISRRFPMGISSATIRNEMSDLEELGLIEQPHTSAGRIPSAKGYRLYVDELMNSESVSLEQWDVVRAILRDKTRQLDSMLKDIGDLLATLTRYTTIVTTPQITKVRLKHLQLIPLDKESVILVLVTDGNIVRNHVIPVKGSYSQEDLYQVTDVLNQYLCGLTVSDINLPLIQKIKNAANMDQGMMESFLDAIYDTLQNTEDVNVFTAGASNMLNFPEFSDVGRARDFMEFVQQKDQVKRLLQDEKESESRHRKGNLKIFIGSENQIQQLQDCSVVTATYRYKSFDLGSISIVGPMRMDYDRVVTALEYLADDFPGAFDADSSTDKKEEKQ
jgi:heat-inducible transcriptional repressor